MNRYTPTIPCNPAGIPHEIRGLRQFIVWSLEPPVKVGDNKLRKLPRNPRTGAPAKSNDPETWGTYEEACRAFASGRYAGIGLLFDPKAPEGMALTGFDMDNCRDPETGILTDYAQGVLDSVFTYAEVSQSGTGVKGLALARKPGTECKRGDVEMYDSVRFFALTGHRVEGMPETVEARQEEINHLHKMWFPEKYKPSPAPAPRRPGVVTGTDAELLEKARNARNGAKFEALWNGNIAGYPGESEATIALCYLLAFWFAGDEARMDSVFRQSGLMRPKWDERRRDSTWGRDRIRKAIAGTSEFYDPDKDCAENGAAEEWPLPAPNAFSDENAGVENDPENVGFSSQHTPAGGSIDAPESADFEDNGTPLETGESGEFEGEPVTLPLRPMTTPEAWKREGKRLSDWKMRAEDALARAIGKWWATDVTGLEYGQKTAFGRQLLGLKGKWENADISTKGRINRELAKWQDWASVYTAWIKHGIDPEDMPYYALEVLRTQPAEVKAAKKQQFADDRRAKRPRQTRASLREELKISEPTAPMKEPTDNALVLSLLTSSQITELANIVKREGSEAIRPRVGEAIRQILFDDKLQQDQAQAEKMLNAAYENREDTETPAETPDSPLYSTRIEREDSPASPPPVSDPTETALSLADERAQDEPDDAREYAAALDDPPLPGRGQVPADAVADASPARQESPLPLAPPPPPVSVVAELPAPPELDNLAALLGVYRAGHLQNVRLRVENGTESFTVNNLHNYVKASLPHIINRTGEAAIRYADLVLLQAEWMRRAGSVLAMAG